MPEQTPHYVQAKVSDQTKGTGLGEIYTRFDGLGGHLRSTRFTMLLSALVVAAIVATAGFTISHTRVSTLVEHQRSMNSMGVILAEQTSRYIQVIDLVLQEVQAKIAGVKIADPTEFQYRLGTEEIHHYLAERLKNLPQVDSVVLIDADGLISNWSRDWPVFGADISRRDYYHHFKEHDDPGVFVGAVSHNIGTGKLSLFIGRRINMENGRFFGLVLAVVDIEGLSALYQAVGQHSKESITLLRRDGTMLMRYPDPAAAIGVKLPQGSPWYDRVAGGGGNYIAPGALDGIPSLVSVHPLRNYPLVVDVLIEEADAFSQWRKQVIFIASFALTVAVDFAGLFWILARQFRRQAEQNAKLDIVLSNITQGVCFFDGKSQLLLWNRRYVEIYNLPPEAARAGRSLKEIVAYRYAAGSSANMSQSHYLAWRNDVATKDHPSNTVVTLRNGRGIAIHHQPMPDGGWVATHEDITERQQAEASVAFMARHDALTKLPNRVLFQERMLQALDMAGRGGQFAVFCLDLDKFKEVNDTMGHPVGDALLVAVADRLQACVREGDTVARLGATSLPSSNLPFASPTTPRYWQSALSLH